MLIEKYAKLVMVALANIGGASVQRRTLADAHY